MTATYSGAGRYVAVIVTGSTKGPTQPVSMLNAGCSTVGERTPLHVMNLRVESETQAMGRLLLVWGLMVLGLAPAGAGAGQDGVAP